jgi:hypothetical protein
MVCVISRGTVPFPPGHHVHARRVKITFETGTIPVGERRGRTGNFAYLDPNDPDVADGLNTLRGLPEKWEVVDCPDSDVPARRVEHVQAMVRNDDKVPHPVRRAFTNGWTLMDLWGVGAEEKWDEKGGRSPRTGLTVLEMATTVPPPSWKGQWVAEHYPWEDLAFRKPYPDWTPANMPIKGAPAKVAQEAVPEAHDEPPPAPEEPAEVSAPPAPVTEHYADLVTAIAKWRESNDPTILDDYGTPEQVQAAIGLLGGLSATGTRPSVSKFNFSAARRRGNPGLPEAEPNAFLAFNAILDTLG